MEERPNAVTVYFDRPEDAERFAAEVASAHVAATTMEALYVSAVRMSAIKLQVEEGYAKRNGYGHRERKKKS